MNYTLKRLNKITCPCCNSANAERLSKDLYFKCGECNLLIGVNKNCCSYTVFGLPRNTEYRKNVIPDLSMDLTYSPQVCIVCGKKATLGRSGAAWDTEEWANTCKICGAMMHSSGKNNCGGFSENYCPECKKYMAK